MTDTDALGLVAIGLAHDFWRGQWETVEQAHIHRPPHRMRRITDGEMFQINVKITRIMLEELRLGFDLDEVVKRLTDDGLYASSWVPGAADQQKRSVADLLGPYYDDWRAAVQDTAAQISHDIEESGLVDVLTRYARFATLTAPHWWSGPGWPAMVDAFVDGLQEPPPGLPLGLANLRVVRDLLHHHPDRLGAQVLQWCVDHGIRRGG
jgi:hypothetical protein